MVVPERLGDYHVNHLQEDRFDYHTEKTTMSTIKDKVWMYGAVCGAYHTPHYRLPGVSTIDCATACRRYGLTKAVMDVCVKGPAYPFDAESEKLAFLDELVWTIIPSGGVVRNEEGFFDMEEIIRQIQKFPNVKGVFCDDFQNRRRTLCSPEKFVELKNRVVAASPRPIDLWLVVYATDVFTERATPHHILDYKEGVDTVSFWTWHPFHLKVLKDNLGFFMGKWPGKKVNLGLYLWDFSSGKPLDDRLMEYQLELALELLHTGVICGVTVCASCIMGLGIKAEDIFARWLERHGDEEINSAAIHHAETVGDNERL